MVEITDSAVEQFKKIVSVSDVMNPNIRIFVSRGGCCGPAYGLDITEDGEDGDVLIDKGNLKIYVDPAVYEGLSRATIDYRDGFIMVSGRRQPSRCG